MNEIRLVMFFYTGKHVGCDKILLMFDQDLRHSEPWRRMLFGILFL